MHSQQIIVICSRIQPNLWVGPTLRTGEDYDQLISLKITAILRVQDESDRGYSGVDTERTMATRAGFVFESAPVKDFNNAELQRCLPECVDTLARLLGQGHAVYIHCHSGVSRSPTVVAAYLHWCLGWELDRALLHLRQCRPCFPIEAVIRNGCWRGSMRQESV
jgi:protein-tyrosine phosphatase